MTSTTIPEEAVKAMPERIYASTPSSSSGCVVSFDVPSLAYDVEYVRADLAIPHLPGVGVKKLADAALSESVNSYVADYEFRGDNGDYTPTDAERVMLEDAIEGFLSNFLSALEPSAARELALEERLQAIEQQLVVNLGYFHDEKRILLETLQSHIISHISAIRALGTSREQLNKAVSNVPDQQKNEPGAHGERETVLDEVIALCRDYGEDSQPDSEYRLACNDIIEAIQERHALSSPDHADAGKVEGNGWAVSTPKFHRYPYFVENIGGKWCLCKHHGNGASHTISVHETASEARSAAPSQEVAGS